MNKVTADTTFGEFGVIIVDTNDLPITEDTPMETKTDRKRYNLSLPPESAAELERRAKAAGVPPTRYAAQLVTEALGAPLRPYGWQGETEDDTPAD